MLLIAKFYPFYQDSLVINCTVHLVPILKQVCSIIFWKFRFLQPWEKPLMHTGLVTKEWWKKLKNSQMMVYKGCLICKSVWKLLKISNCHWKSKIWFQTNKWKGLRPSYTCRDSEVKVLGSFITFWKNCVFGIFQEFWSFYYEQVL